MCVSSSTIRYWGGYARHDRPRLRRRRRHGDASLREAQQDASRASQEQTVGLITFGFHHFYCSNIRNTDSEVKGSSPDNDLVCGSIYKF